jgi:hypothetical protein
LNVDATQSLALVDGAGRVLTEPSRSPVSTSGSAFGAGDLLLRTKYRFLDGPVNLAAGVAVRFPSGNPNNFFGLGDYVVSPFMVVSRLVGLPDLFAFGPGLTDLHASLAVDANASNLDASRIRYTAGVAWQWDDRFALLTDFIGSSAFTEDEFTISAAGAGATPYNGINLVNAVPAGNQVKTTYAVQRTDILSLAMGLKVALPRSGTAFLGAIIPMSDDGMRADVIPAGGVEFGF